MTDATKTQQELLAEIEVLRLRLDEAEETLRAIGSGEVDAFVVSGPEGEQQVFTLKGAELPYRILVESMNEGATTLAADGTILYCNKRLSSLLKIPLENLIGTKLGSYVEPDSCLTYAALLENCTQEPTSDEITLMTVAGDSIPVFMSCCANDISGTQGKSVVVTDLTLQRRNSEILASEKFSTSIFDQACEAMIVCDVKGKIIKASQSAHSLCGTNPLLKQFNKIFQLQISESGKKFSLEQLMRVGNVTSIEVEFKRNDKQIFNLLLNATTLRNLQNLDIGFVVNLTDITKCKTAEMALQLSEVRLQSAYSHLQVVNEELQTKNHELLELCEITKRSEEAVRKSEERLALATSATQIGMFDHDLINGKVLWTQTHEAIFGYIPASGTTTEYDYSKWSERVHPDDLPLIEEEGLRCMKDREPVAVQYRIIWPDGSLHWVETRGAFQYESDGTASRMLGVVMDITDRIESQEMLRLSEERHRVLAETMLQGVVHQDASGKIISMNPAAEHILGKSREDFLGNSSISVAHDTIRENGDFFPDFEHPAMVALRTGMPVRGVIMGVFNPTLKEYRWIDIDAVPVIRPGENLPSEVYSVFADITKSNQAQKELFQKEERLRLALDAAKMATWDWHVPSGEVIWNDMHYRMMGYEPGEVQPSYQAWANRVHPDDFEAVQKRIQESMGGGSVFTAEFRTRWPDGTVRWLEACGETEYSSNNEPLRQYGVMLDTTERKKAENALRESEERFRLALKNSPVSVAIQDRNLVYQWAYNQKTRRQDEIIGKTDADLFPEEFVWINEIKQRVLDTGTEERVAHWMTSNGQRLYLDITYEPLRNSVGDIIGIGIAVVNLTDLKLAEQAVQKSEEQLRTLADSIPNLAWWANSDGYITWYNRRWYEYTGTTPEQMEGWGWQSVHDPVELPMVLERWQYSLSTGEPFDMTFPLRGADGVFRPFLTRVIPLKDDAGGVQQWFGTNTDVSELEQRVTDRTKELAASISHLQSEICERELAEIKLLEETSVRLQATEALREKELMLIQQSRQAAMGEMIGNIAHQWRQPLNTLGLYTQRLGMFYGSPNFNKEFLDKSIAKSMEIIKHMSKTIDDFRDYFKPEKEKADFYVIEAIKNTLSLLESNFHNPEITIDFVDHDNPVINGYQNEFAQVFLNILNNARDAMIEREIADGRITITIYSENGCAVVTVSDNAGGIPDEFINKVFDPYFTTKGPQVGTGIGLFMSKTIIEKNMGGRLTVSNSEIGAEFRIEVAHGTQN